MSYQLDKDKLDAAMFRMQTWYYDCNADECGALEMRAALIAWLALSSASWKKAGISAADMAEWDQKVSEWVEAWAEIQLTKTAMQKQ